MALLANAGASFCEVCHDQVRGPNFSIPSEGSTEAFSRGFSNSQLHLWRRRGLTRAAPLAVHAKHLNSLSTVHPQFVCFVRKRRLPNIGTAWILTVLFGFMEVKRLYVVCSFRWQRGTRKDGIRREEIVGQKEGHGNLKPTGLQCLE